MGSGPLARSVLASLVGLSLAGLPAAAFAQTAKEATSAGKRWEEEFSLWQKVSSGSDIAQYEGYLKQQEREVKKLRSAESRRLPDDLDYSNMPGLSREIVEKLSRVKPQSIAQASRIPGITPASLSILLFHLEMRHAATRSS